MDPRESKKNSLDAAIKLYNHPSSNADYLKAFQTFVEISSNTENMDNNLKALFMMAKCLLIGLGTDKNESLALSCFIRSATLGNDEALEFLKDQFPAFARLAIATRVHAIRYMDSISLMEDYKDNTEITPAEMKFQTLSKAMLFGYGSSHSYQKQFYNMSEPMGFFADSYTREEEDWKKEKKLLSKEKQKATHYFMEESGIISPFKPFIVTDLTSVRRTFGRSNTLIESTKELKVSGKTFNILEIKDQNFESFHEKLGHLGQFPSKDDQLWLVASLPDFEEIFIRYLLDSNPTIQSMEEYKDFIPHCYEPSSRDAVTIAKEINNLLEVTLTENKRQSAFYLKLMNDLIKPLCVKAELLVKMPEEQYYQLTYAFSRLEYLLKMAIKSVQTYEFFLLYLNYAFDEIIYINALSSRYSKDDIKGILKKFIDEQYLIMGYDRSKATSLIDTYDEKTDAQYLDQPYSQELKTNISLCRSGMDALSNGIALAIEEIKAGEFKSISLHLEYDIYYEQKHMLETYFGKSLAANTSFNLESDEKETKVLASDTNKLVDILICGFVENVSTSTSPSKKFKSHDVDQLIEIQLAMRKENKRKLILVIDNTQLSFASNRMSTLLMNFKSEIEEGRIAIISIYSLNKYFHMGFDKTPAAISAAFFKPDKFPVLQKFFQENWLIGYQFNDSVPQMITYMVEHASKRILKYYDIIKNNTDFLHEELVPESLYDESNPLITIDYPYTSDAYQEIWGFLAFRIKPGFLSQFIEKQISTLITVAQRDGYGFSTTTVSFIEAYQTKVFRFSIGTESTDELIKIFGPMIEYFYKANEIVGLYLTTHGKDVTIEKLKELADSIQKQLSNTSVEVKTEEKKMNVDENILSRSSFFMTYLKKNSGQTENTLPDELKLKRKQRDK